jgi:hypothetical protein
MREKVAYFTSITLLKKNRDFKFDLSWLKNHEVLLLLNKIWKIHVSSRDPSEIFNIKLKIFKKHFKGLRANLFGMNKKERWKLKMNCKN